MSLQEHSKDQFDNSSDEELEKVIRGYKPMTPEHQHCSSLLNRRHNKSQFTKLSSIDNRLSAVERVVIIPEHKTWTFLLVLLTLIVTLIGVVITFFESRDSAYDADTLDRVSPNHSQPIKSQGESE